MAHGCRGPRAGQSLLHEPMGPQGPRLLLLVALSRPRLLFSPYGYCWFATSKSEFWFMRRGKKWRMCNVLCTGSSGKLRTSWPARGVGTRLASPSAPLSWASPSRGRQPGPEGKSRSRWHQLVDPPNLPNTYAAPCIKRGTTVPLLRDGPLLT